MTKQFYAICRKNTCNLTVISSIGYGIHSYTDDVAQLELEVEAYAIRWHTGSQ